MCIRDSFWCEVRRWRLTALFFLVSGALAGLLLAVGLALGSPGKLLGRVYYARVSWPVLLGTALGMSLLLRLVFGQAARHGGNEIMSITISLGGKCCTVRALHDTGCTLRDPVTGGPVLVLERRALDPLWTPPVRDILCLLYTSENRPVQRRAARQEHRRRVERPARRAQQKPQTPQRRSRKARADQKQHVVQRQIQRKHPVDVDHRHGGPSPLRPSL